MFKSPKEVEWATEILGYAFIPPHYQYVKEDKNYLKYILNIYEFMVCGELEIVNDGKSQIKTATSKVRWEIYIDLMDFFSQFWIMRTTLTRRFFWKCWVIWLCCLINGTLKRSQIHWSEVMKEIYLLCWWFVLDPRIREEEMKVPIKLCAIVIRIYNKFLFKAYPFLYIDHWEYIIKLLLGLASHILQVIRILCIMTHRKRQAPIQNSLTEYVSPSLNWFTILGFFLGCKMRICGQHSKITSIH